MRCVCNLFTQCNVTAEGIDISGTPLSLRGGRGRPARFISDMMSTAAAAGTYNPAQLSAAQLLINSAGGRGGGGGGGSGGGGLHEPEDSNESLGLNGETDITSAQAAAQAAAMMVGGLPTTVPTNGTAATPDSMNNEFSSSNGHEDPEKHPDEHQHLTMAVELAAVNQAIIALSGQTPIAIKPESKSIEESKKTSKNVQDEKASSDNVSSSQKQAEVSNTS